VKKRERERERERENRGERLHRGTNARTLNALIVTEEKSSQKEKRRVP
jgi:hypothetical protein